LIDGTLSFVVTDHAGSIPENDKSSDNFWEVYGGIPGVEHRVPFLFSEGFLKNRITLEKTINLLSKNVANLFGIKNKGEMNVGFDSDFALINLWNNEIVSSDKMHSKGKFTPFEGVKFNATVEKTWLRGKVVADKYNKNEIKYNGEFIPVKIH
jgi:dihydroorotase-like cyclic amidohydrolase